MRALFAAILLWLGFAVAAASAQTCTQLHYGGDWIIVAKGEEAVEYQVKSREAGWRIISFPHVVHFCADCGQVVMTAASDRNNLTIDRWMAEGAKPFGEEALSKKTSFEMGALKGGAVRFADPKSDLSGLVTETDDGCVRLELFVQFRGSIDGSRFADPTIVSAATSVERIPRGRVADLDLHCFKNRSAPAFAHFQSQIFEPKPEPISPLPYAEFRQRLDMKNQFGFSSP